jgi:hypothetical protein
MMAMSSRLVPGWAFTMLEPIHSSDSEAGEESGDAAVRSTAAVLLSESVRKELAYSEMLTCVADSSISDLFP